MQLRALPHFSFPKLAWVAEVNCTSGIVTLRHGSLVDVRQNFFIEGVWNGPFQNGNFGETDCVFGSGGILGHESIRFVTSASTTDYLYYAEEGGQVTVCNSLPLLLARIGDALDLRCPEYPEICDSILEGIDDYRRDIPTKRGKIRRLMYRNLDVSRGKISESDKNMPPRFLCFEDYRDYLRDNYAAIAANARDGARTQPLEICSTQSKGYDSTAVNAIAAPFKIDKVFTVTEAKSLRHLAHQRTGPFPDDDGSPICEALHLPCIRLSRHAFEDGAHEQWHYSALHLSQDMNLDGMLTHLTRPSVLLTGTLGEIWYTRSTLGTKAYLTPDLRRWDLGGHGMSELRLMAGFIHLPLPYIGARRKGAIVAITESEEMDRRRLGTTYDRPIPRRIAEEAGVPRHLFGQSKMGSVVLFAAPTIPHGRTLRKAFFTYLAEQGLMPRWQSVCWPIVRAINAKISTSPRWLYYAVRVISKVLRRAVQLPLLWMRLDGALFCYCVNKTANSYFGDLSRENYSRFNHIARRYSAGSMTQGRSIPVSCCGCGRRYCGRSPRKTFWDDAMNVLGWYPWRCGGCGTRFYLRREARIGPLEKWDSAGRQDDRPSLEKKSA